MVTINIPIQAAHVQALLNAKAGDVIVLSAGPGCPPSGVTVPAGIKVEVQSAADVVKIETTVVKHLRDGTTQTQTVTI
jgi:hypothetical protein